MIGISGPYLIYAKLGAAAILIALAVGGGCSIQKARDADERHALEMKIGEKDRAIDAAATALRGSAAAIREINEEAAREVAAAERESQAFADAAKVANAARLESDRKAAALAEQFDRAKRARPGCDQLARMTVDLEGQCGITIR